MVELGGAPHGHGFDAGELRGDFLFGGRASGDDERQLLGGGNVWQHQADADRHLAYGVEVHPGDGAFELFQHSERLVEIGHNPQSLPLRGSVHVAGRLRRFWLRQNDGGGGVGVA